MADQRPPVTNPTFVLLIGPSGSGKNTLIKALHAQDSRFKYVTPYTDRPRRPNETEKMCVSSEEFTHLENTNTFVIVNHIFTYRYGTPRTLIDKIIHDRNIPILDFLLPDVEKLHMYKDILYKIYIMPPSIEVLQQRLQLDGRDKDGVRFENGKNELLQLQINNYQHPAIDDRIINNDIHQSVTSLLSKIYTRISQSNK